MILKSSWCAANRAAAADGVLVREFAGGRRLTSMTLEHYPGMAEAEIARFAAQAAPESELPAVPGK